MTKSKIFLSLALSFIGGILLRSFLEWEMFFTYLLLIIAIMILAVFWKDKKARLAGFCLLFLVLGIFLTEKKLEKIKTLDLDGQAYAGTAQVAKEPELSGDYQRIVLAPENFSGKVLSYVSPFSTFGYGDKVKVECTLELPKKQEDFDYPMYLAKDGIFYLCQKAQITVLEKNQGNKIYSAILKLKNNFETNLEKLFPSPESGLLSGILLGGSGKLPKETQNDFSRTGLTHVVAVSGYNVTIIAEYLILFGIFIGLWRRQALWFALAGIFLFVLMVGLPASAVRAGIMGSLLIWAMKSGRLANSQNAIIFAGAVMLFINPLLLRYDVGFQLSFLATLGIVYLSPFMEIQAIKKNKAFGWWEILILTLSAQIFVLPVILYNFKNLSLISPLANILVLPFIPLTMLLGFLAGLAEFIFHPLAILFSWLAFLPLKYEIEIVHYLSSLSWASVAITNFPWQGIIIWYLILAFLLVLLKKYVQPKNNL